MKAHNPANSGIMIDDSRANSRYSDLVDSLRVSIIAAGRADGITVEAILNLNLPDS